MAKKIRVWDGTQWQDVAPSLPYTAIHSAQASMPLTGVDGQVWLDTDGTLAGQDFVPLSGGTMTGNLNVPSINSGGIAGQNYLLNGALDFWQRGTSTTSMNVYLADRWIVQNNNTYYRSTDVPTSQGFQYSAGWGYTAGASFPLICYRMSAEEAILFAGKTITLSFWAKNVSGTAALYAEYLTPNGTNNFSAVTNQGLIGFYGSPSGTWTRYTATFTATTDLVRGLEFRIVRGNQSASETLTTGFKLEIGNQATAFTRANPDLATELAACRYYYQVLGALYGYALASDAIQGLVAADSMRTNPSCVMLTSTPYGESPINVTARNGVNSTTVGSPDINKYGSVIVRVTGFNGMTAGQTALVSAGQIALSAEL